MSANGTNQENRPRYLHNRRYELMTPEQKELRAEALEELALISATYLQTREQQLRERTDAIIKAWRDGATQQEISKATGLTSGRISQLITEYLRELKAKKH